MPRHRRAFLVCAALVCLCVSDGVGPRLLPYPAASGSECAPEAAPDPAAEQGSPQAASSTLPHHRSEAGDSLKKIPVFSAPDSAFAETALVAGLAGDLSLPSPRTVSTSHRLGRAPPASY